MLVIKIYTAIYASLYLYKPSYRFKIKLENRAYMHIRPIFCIISQLRFNNAVYLLDDAHTLIQYP
jgi:hypothetical protein